MCEECAPSLSVDRMLGHSGRSGFSDDVGYVDDSTSYNTHEIMFLGSCLIWNDAAVCGERIRANVFVRVLSDMWIRG